MIPTAYVALISNSVTLYADLLRCLAEFSAILCAWLVVRKIESEDESTFNYGFGKLERLSSLLVAAALFVTFLVSLSLGLRRLWYPEVLQNSEYGFLFAILSVAGNAILWRLNYKHEAAAASPVIDSQWRLFRAKTAASSAVVLSLGVGMFFSDYAFAQYADPFGALVLSAFILYSAITIVSDSMNDLVDRSLEEALQMIILAALVKYDSEYMGLERIRSRRSGNRVYVELFLMFADERSMADIRDSATRIRAELEANIPGSEVTIIPC